MYSELYLRLEPIGLERVAAAVRTAGHEVRMLDLQIFSHADYRAELDAFRPQAVGFSVNYLANVPEVIDLAQETKRLLPGSDDIAVETSFDGALCDAMTGGIEII